MRHVRPGGARLWVALVPVLLLASGCSPSGGSPEGRQPTAADRAQWVLPLDEFLRPKGSWTLTDYAENLLVADCMPLKGFQWPVVPIDADAPRSPTRSASGARIFDEKIAQQLGYREVPDLPPATQHEIEALNSRKLSAAEESAFASCLQEARTTLPLPEDSQLGQILVGNALKDAVATKAVRTAAQAWRTCMLPQGISDLPDGPVLGDGSGMPTDSQRAAFGLDDDPDGPPGADEIRAAVADATCRTSSGYTDALFRAQWDAQAALVTKNADQLVRDRDATSAYETAARAVLTQRAGS